MGPSSLIFQHDHGLFIMQKFIDDKVTAYSVLAVVHNPTIKNDLSVSELIRSLWDFIAVLNQ